MVPGRPCRKGAGAEDVDEARHLHPLKIYLVKCWAADKASNAVRPPCLGPEAARLAAHSAGKTLPGAVWEECWTNCWVARQRQAGLVETETNMRPDRKDDITVSATAD